MSSRDDTIWSNLRALVVGWLVVAMLLPPLLAMVPKAQASPPADLLQISELQLCAQLGHLADGERDKFPGSQRRHDCPCCLPSFSGLAALPPHEVALLPAANWRIQKQVLVEFALRRLAGQPHHFATARAPPSILPV